MKLQTWISANGGRVAVARQLGVTPQALYYWLSGKSVPKVATLLKLVKLSKNQLTISGMIEEIAVRPGRVRK